MPLISPASGVDGAFQQPFSQGGVSQVIQPAIPVPVPSSIAAGGNWNSGLIFADGFRYLSIGVTSSQPGTIVIQQYLDMSGSVARTPISTALVAATPLIVDVADLKPFVTFTLAITIPGGTPGAITGFAVLMGAG